MSRNVIDVVGIAPCFAEGSLRRNVETADIGSVTFERAGRVTTEPASGDLGEDLGASSLGTGGRL